MKREIDDAREADRYGVRRDLQAEGAHHVYYAVIGEGLLERLSLILSDCLHNLRASLDHLVFALSTANLATRSVKLTEPKAKGLQFPICDDARTFADETPRRLYGLSAAAIALVTSHQPYTGEYADLRHSPIRQLRNLQNVDKHRHLVAVNVERGDSFVMAGLPTADRPIEERRAARVVRGDPLEDGAELTRFIFREPKPDVDVKYRPSLLVVIDEGPSRPIATVIESIVVQIETILYHAERLPEVV